ncbi:MAG: gamma-glutamyltransferase family protein [Thermoleophilaceae bacterium]
MIRSEIATSRTEVVSERGVVSCGHIEEAEAGVRVLEGGGNAVDAVVAAAFTGHVVEPASCGLGGYGHMALFLAQTRQLVSVDHYVRAPAAARADMFEVDPSRPATYYGWPRVAGRRNEWGATSVAVPGAVAGLCSAHERWGRRPLAQVLDPAIEAAERGVRVGWDLVLAIARRLEEIQALPNAAALLLREGRPPKLPDDGDLPDAEERIDLSRLAETLREIARRGAAGFYNGWVAEAIAREINAGGGILTRDDLEWYQPRIGVEPGAWYRGIRYSTASDPVGYEALNILGCFELAGYRPDSSEYRHLMAEAMGCAFADSMHHYGDRDLGDSPVDGLASPAFAAARAATIRLDRAAPRPIVPGDPWPYERRPPVAEAATRPSASRLSGTSQMVAADAEGNVAALITSLSAAFGSLVLVPEAGFFLNNAMCNFDPRPDRANCIAPGKMPIFAVPAIAAERDGVGVFGAGGGGGYRITSGVLHALVNHFDFGMSVQQAVDGPRVHCQGEETFVDSRIPVAVRDRLRALGHVVVQQDEVPAPINFSRVSAVARDPATGALSAGSSPAWNTAAAGL